MDVGNLSDIVGAAAVIASVLYLAIQIKKHTHESQMAATREISGAFSNWLELVAVNPEFGEIFNRGIDDYESLSDFERLRFSYFLNGMFRRIEQQYLHTAEGDIDPKFYESVSKPIDLFLKYKGVRKWWGVAGPRVFGDEFRAHIDQRMRVGLTE